MPGDAGAKAALATIASPPDGTVLMVATFGTHAINPSVTPGLDYDPFADLTSVMLPARSPMVLAVHPFLPAATVPDLVAVAARRRLTCSRYCARRRRIPKTPATPTIMSAKDAGSGTTVTASRVTLI